MADGQSGQLDWVGYPIGAPPPPLSPGYVGLLDFTGVPVGVGAAAPAAPEGEWMIIMGRRRKQR